MTCAIEVGKPDWRPLENAIPSDYAEDFMFMGKAGDIVLYKQIGRASCRERVCSTV